MSQIIKVQTVFTDWKALRRALQICGVPLEQQVFSSQSTTRVRDYYGKLIDKEANLIVKRETLGSHADLGFIKQENGKIEIIGDDIDMHRTFGPQWMSQLKQEYAAEKAHITWQDTYAAQNYSFNKVRNSDGSITITMEK